MNIIKVIVFALCCSWSGFSQAGDIREHFETGFLGVNWGDSLSKVQQRYSGGETETWLGRTTYYGKNDTTVFGIRRSKQAGHLAKFGLDFEDRLTSVAVTMNLHDYDKLRNILEAKFGHYTVSSDKEGTRATWPEDGGIGLFIWQTDDEAGLTVYRR